jgi:tetratricopeptide (TPR) repeat protein
MGIFRNQFIRSADGSASGGQATTPEEIFEQEFQATIPRYLSKPGVNVDLKMRHKETNEIMTFAEAFPGQFESWKTIQSLPDRRGLIYSILDNIMGNDLKLWQIIERFVDDRYAQRALEVAKTHADENDKYSADYWAAVAKANLVLSDYIEAEKSANNALVLDAGNLRAKMVLADVLHITGKTEAAHALYNEVLRARLPRNAELSLSFIQLVGFDGNILPSPLYALDWLQSHPDTTADTWNRAADEFYYSPHFRAQHAYYLLKEKEAMLGFVKLFTLAKEMPWYKEAVINSWQLVHQLGLAENMPEGKAWLKGVMESNKWDADDHGMHKKEL